MQHADDGYSRRENVGGSLVRNMVLTYSTDNTDVYVYKTAELSQEDRAMRPIYGGPEKF